MPNPFLEPGSPYAEAFSALGNAVQRLDAEKAKLVLQKSAKFARPVGSAALRFFLRRF